MTWITLQTPTGETLISPTHPRLALEVVPLPSGRLTARWRDVVTGETSGACVAPVSSSELTRPIVVAFV